MSSNLGTLNTGMRAAEFITEADLKRRAALAALGGAGALGLGYKMMNPRTTVKHSAAPPIDQPSMISQPETPAYRRAVLMDVAIRSGITGEELNHLMAQADKETRHFQDMEERGDLKYLRRYDKTVDPQRAARLGNTEVGDGVRFHGRGYIMLTGRYNYTRAQRELGIPLLTEPELAAQPSVAAQIAVWYWMNRVKPRINPDKIDSRSVTRAINPNAPKKDVLDRERRYQQLAGASD